MIQTVRITSKRQITIPAELFRALNLAEGDRLAAQVEKGRLLMQKSQNILDEIAGSLVVPRKYKGMPLDKIIDKAKKEYFKKNL